jgi:hypothetical protein
MNTEFIQQRVEVDSPSLTCSEGGYGGGGVMVDSARDVDGWVVRRWGRREGRGLLGRNGTAHEYGGGEDETGGD